MHGTADFQAADGTELWRRPGPSQIAERGLQALDAADASVAGLPGTVAGIVLPASFAARIGAVISSQASCAIPGDAVAGARP